LTGWGYHGRTARKDIELSAKRSESRFFGLVEGHVEVIGHVHRAVAVAGILPRAQERRADCGADGARPRAAEVRRFGARFDLGNDFFRSCGRYEPGPGGTANRSLQFDFSRKSVAIAVSAVPPIQGSKSIKLALVEAIWAQLQHVYNGALWSATRVGVVLLGSDVPGLCMLQE
jgi:hypothetical protein